MTAQQRRWPLARRRFIFWATVVLLVAAGLRLLGLEEVPPGLSQDEILDADIALFIRQGYRAIFFREGYGHEPLYHYLAAPFQALWGDNILSIRVPAGYLGLLVVALTMRWAGQTFGRCSALPAGAWLAISWWPIVFSRIGLRPILLPVVLLLAALCWPWPQESNTAGMHRRAILSGALLGLSLYTYTAAQVVFLIPLLYGLYLLLGRFRPAGDVLRLMLYQLVPLALVALPLVLTLRADPSLLQRVDQLAGPLEALREGNVRPVLQTTLATLGVFAFTGDPRPTYMLPGRPLFDPLTAVLFFAGLLLALWRARQQARYGFVLIWLAVGLIPSAVTPQAPSTVRLVGVMPVVYLLPALALVALGEWWITERRLGRTQVWAMLAVAVLAFGLAQTLWYGFMRWPADLETRLRYQTVFQAIAGEIAQHPEGTPVIAEAYFEPIDHDSVRRNLGAPLDARWVQQHHALVFPAGNNARLYVPEYAAPAGELLAASLLAEPLYRSPDEPSYSVYLLPDEPQMPLLAEPVSFAGAVSLLGHQQLPAGEDGNLRLLSYWRVEEVLPADLAVFVHVLDTSGEVLTQFDGLDAAPQRLQPGDRFLQLHHLPAPQGMVNGTPAGPYAMHIGLYTRDNGQRLARPGDLPAWYVLAEDVFVDAK